MTIQVKLHVAHYGQKRPASPSAEHHQWETVCSLLKTSIKPLAKTMAEGTAPVGDLTFDRGYNKVVEDSSPPLMRTIFFDNPFGPNHPLHTSSRRSTNHNASATVSAPPFIEVEKLIISIQTKQPTSPRLPRLQSDEAPDLWTEDRVLGLQRFCHLLIVECSGGITEAPTSLAYQLL